MRIFITSIWHVFNNVAPMCTNWGCSIVSIQSMCLKKVKSTVCCGFGCWKGQFNQWTYANFFARFLILFLGWSHVMYDYSYTWVATDIPIAFSPIYCNGVYILSLAKLLLSFRFHINWAQEGSLYFKSRSYLSISLCIKTSLQELSNSWKRTCQASDMSSIISNILLIMQSVQLIWLASAIIFSIISWAKSAYCHLRDFSCLFEKRSLIMSVY